MSIRIPGLAAGLLLATSGISIVIILAWNHLDDSLPSLCSRLLDSQPSCRAGVGKIFTYAWVLAFLPLIMLVERWRPADPSQPVFSPGLFVDSLWFFTFPLLGIWLPTAFEGLLKSTVGAAIAGAKFDVLASLPLVVQFILVILLSDFLAWLGHFLRHKIPITWEFHKIHHSQVELNYFSARRLHPFDLMFNALIRFLPFTLLGMELALPGYLFWTIFVRFWEAFVHSNVKFNLGPLKYILVTPQSHRVHHSIESRHIDKKFGDFFSIWDFMFGTQCREYEVYPRLGVADTQCPSGTAITWTGALGVFLRELVYPFQALLGRSPPSPDISPNIWK
jgi:sterol desaturase/sphingolipid hydroxylase (fatty acid hydroxylase superfamily)